MYKIMRKEYTNSHYLFYIKHVDKVGGWETLKNPKEKVLELFYEDKIYKDYIPCHRIDGSSHDHLRKTVGLHLQRNASREFSYKALSYIRGLYSISPNKEFSHYLVKENNHFMKLNSEISVKKRYIKDALSEFMKGNEVLMVNEQGEDCSRRLIGAVVKSMDDKAWSIFSEFLKKNPVKINVSTQKPEKRLTLIEKIKEFEKTEQTVKEFNRVFKADLEQDPSLLVEIGAPIGPETRRSLNVGESYQTYYFSSKY